MEKPSKKRDRKLQENGIDSLPLEIALDIFSRLNFHHIFDAVQVAKRDPLLIFHSDFPIRNQLCFAEISGTDDGFDGIVKKIKIPFSASMPEFNVVGSCNGLLCLCDSLYKDAVYVYNPFTNDYHELPKTKHYDEQQVVCGFGYHPETNQYKVVKIVYYWIVNFGARRSYKFSRDSISEVSVLSLGGNTWRNIGQVPYYIERSQGALFTCGRLHWQTRGSHNDVRGLIIISFDLADEKFYEIPSPHFVSFVDARYYHLANLKGCLSAVVFKFGSKEWEIWVMKESLQEIPIVPTKIANETCPLGNY